MKFFVNQRINKDNIKQYHISERKLVEGEILRTPGQYWVDWFEVSEWVDNKKRWQREIIKKMTEQSKEVFNERQTNNKT